jgi:hypothetical protein
MPPLCCAETQGAVEIASSHTPAAANAPSLRVIFASVEAREG